jgi:hypothetical protein
MVGPKGYRVEQDRKPLTYSGARSISIPTVGIIRSPVRAIVLPDRHRPTRQIICRLLTTLAERAEAHANVSLRPVTFALI